MMATTLRTLRPFETMGALTFVAALALTASACQSTPPPSDTPADVATAENPSGGGKPATSSTQGGEGSASAPSPNVPKGPAQRVDVPKDAKPMEAHAPDPTAAPAERGKPVPEREPKELAPTAEYKAEYKNTIRWSTASEVDNFGYDVYRGESADGPFDRLTARPIQGAGTSDETHKYEYTDTTIDPTRDYWYFVESISISGVRERFTPVSKAKAKIPKQ